MNIRINDKDGKITYGVMEDGKLVELHSALKAAVLVLLDIHKQEYPNQDFETFKNQLITALDMETEK